MSNDSSDPGRLTILVVDDQRIVVEAVRAALAGQRIEARILWHATAAGAVARAVETHPDLILQDVSLGDGSGVELLDRYRGEAALDGVPVMILSGDEHPATKAEAFARGAADYVVKLPPAVELAARIRAHAVAGRAVRERNRAMADLDEANRLLAVANEALASEVQANRERLAVARQLGEEFSETQDIDVLVERLLEECARSADAEAAILVLREGSRLTLEDAFVPTRSGERFEHPTFPMRECGVVGRAVATGEAVQLATREACAAIEQELCQAIGLDPTVALAVPLSSPNIGAGEIRGILVLLDGRPRGGFLDEQVRQVRHLATMATLAFERARLIRTMILRMVAMAELRDPHETGAHVRRVAGFSVAILNAWARRQAIASGELSRMRDRLYIAALLHDIGKVGIPDAILGKPGRLEPAERTEMERHTTIGAGLFRGLRTDFDDAARAVALAHHQRWDGNGYPADPDAVVPQRGESIPLFARIVAVADVFDALSSPRAYKAAWPEDEVLAHMKGESGRHFDPILVECLLESMPTIRRVQRRFAEQRFAAHETGRDDRSPRPAL